MDRWLAIWQRMRSDSQLPLVQNTAWPLRQKVSGPNFNRALFASQYQLLGLDGDTDASGEVAAMVDPVVSFVGWGGSARSMPTRSIVDQTGETLPVLHRHGTARPTEAVPGQLAGRDDDWSFEHPVASGVCISRSFFRIG